MLSQIATMSFNMSISMIFFNFYHELVCYSERFLKQSDSLIMKGNDGYTIHTQGCFTCRDVIGNI